MAGNQSNKGPVRIIGAPPVKTEPKAAGVVKTTGDVVLYNNTLAPIVLHHAPHSRNIVNPTKLDKVNKSNVTVPARGSVVVAQGIWDKIKVQPAVIGLLDTKCLRVNIGREPNDAMETVSKPTAPGDLQGKSKAEMSGGVTGVLKSNVVEGQVNIENKGMQEITQAVQTQPLQQK